MRKLGIVFVALFLANFSVNSAFAASRDNSLLIPRASQCDLGRVEGLYSKRSDKDKEPFGSGHPWPGVYGTWIDTDRCAFITVKNMLDEGGRHIAVKIMDINDRKELAFARYYYDPDIDEETDTLMIPVERHKFLTKGTYFFELFTESNPIYQAQQSGLYVTVWKKTQKLSVIRDRFTFRRLTQ
jgi:hypothetical protein